MAPSSLIWQSVAEIYLTGVSPLGAVSHIFIILFIIAYICPEKNVPTVFSCGLRHTVLNTYYGMWRWFDAQWVKIFLSLYEIIGPRLLLIWRDKSGPKSEQRLGTSTCKSHIPRNLTGWSFTSVYGFMTWGQQSIGGLCPSMCYWSEIIITWKISRCFIGLKSKFKIVFSSFTYSFSLSSSTYYAIRSSLLILLHLNPPRFLRRLKIVFSLSEVHLVTFMGTFSILMPWFDYSLFYVIKRLIILILNLFPI